MVAFHDLPYLTNGHERQKLALSQHGPQPGIIIKNTIDDAIPILAIIDFKALDGAQMIIRLDEPCHDRFCRTVIKPKRLHSLR